tara:strand:- start:1014 stop:1370 length:357 start_codon:yes stop_codon:yes gene_type:complete
MIIRYFKESEFVCDGQNCFAKMDMALLESLDLAREVADTPFIITSSWRSEEKNKAIGGKPNSAHLKGKAVDISCKNSAKRMHIVDALLYAGFSRIGIAKDFIHADVDKSLPQDVMWIY